MNSLVAVVLVVWLMATPSESALSVSIAFTLSQPRKSMCASSAFDASGSPFVVVAGGLNANDSVSRELIVYDVLREKMRVLSLAVARYDCVACRVDDLIVIAGGCNNTTAPDSVCRVLSVEAFNVTSGELGTLPGGLSAGRKHLAVAETRTHCAFVGGAQPVNFIASRVVDALDVRTRTWTYLNLTESRYFPAAVGVDDTVVVMGSDIGTGPEVRFTVEEIDFSVARPIARIVRNITSSVYENTGARAGDWVIFAGGRRRDKASTLLKPAAEVREPSGLWREIPFAPDWVSDDAPFNLQAGSIGTQAVFALGADDFLSSVGTPYVFLWNPADIDTPSKGWNMRTWNLNITESALATFEYNNTGYTFVAGGAFNYSVAHNAVQLLKFENEPGFEPTCSQCPPPSVCIGDERCRCDATHVREGRFGCKLKPGDTAAPTPMPTTGASATNPMASTPMPTPFPHASASSATSATITTAAADTSSGALAPGPPTPNVALIGGVVGGVVALISVAGVVSVCVWCFLRQEKSTQVGSTLQVPPDAYRSGAADSSHGNYGNYASSMSIRDPAVSHYTSLRGDEV